MKKSQFIGGELVEHCGMLGVIELNDQQDQVIRLSEASFADISEDTKYLGNISKENLKFFRDLLTDILR